jgi:hypothetical protein
VLSSLRWYHVPAVALFFGASRIQNETLQQLAKMRRNKAGKSMAHLVDRSGISQGFTKAIVTVFLVYYVRIAQEFNCPTC